MNNDKTLLSTSMSQMHDIKETSKRISQFGIVAIAVAAVTVISNLFYGNNISALIVAFFIVALLFILRMNSMGKLLFTKVASVIYLNVHFIFIVLAEGTGTGAYLYYCALLFAIPFLVDNNRDYKREVALYFFITISSFIINISIFSSTSSWQYISPVIQNKIYYTNLVSVVFLCAAFAYLTIFQERRYVNALLTQVRKTEDAMEARSRFLSGMGHELRTPLNGIIGANNILKNGRFLNEQKEYFDILKYCSDHMLGLVNDILDYNKIEAGRLELHPIKTNLKVLIEQTALPFYNRFEEKQVDLLIAIDENLNKCVMADDLRLVQVFNNIISNALKFTGNGFVKVSATLVDSDKENLSVLFCIQDTGIGINEKDQERIFDSFWQVYDESTRKYGGTGLGLTICEKLLQLMGTCLELESEEGKGSRFYFTVNLPVCKTKDIDASEIENNSTKLTGKKILLAEDNVINMLIAKKILEDWGAEVTEAEDGQIALGCLSDNNDFDLILLDLDMPNMDGYTAVQKIKVLYPAIPVLAFTAVLMDNEIIIKLESLGFDDCILKPFEPLELLSKIRKHIKSDNLQNVQEHCYHADSA